MDSLQLEAKQPLLVARLLQLAGRHVALSLGASLAQWSGPERYHDLKDVDPKAAISSGHMRLLLEVTLTTLTEIPGEL